MTKSFAPIKTTPPNGNATIEQFRMDNGFLRQAFFDVRHEEHTKYNLKRCLAWADPSNWLHIPSGTLEGGPWGCKWPILLLVFILMCDNSLGDGYIPSYAETISATFTDEDRASIYELADTWRCTLLGSMETLLETTEERVVTTVSLEENRSGQILDKVEILALPDEEHEWAVSSHFNRL